MKEEGPLIWRSEDDSQQVSPLGDMYALVVGVSDYKNNGISGLKLSAKDAQDVAEFFRQQSGLFNETHVKLLTNEKATKAAVEKELYYGLRRAGKDDTVALFFSGHGAEDPYMPGKYFFLTHDSDPENLHATAVKMSGLEFLRAMDARRVLLVADSCHAGGFSSMKTKTAAPALKKFLVEFAKSSGRVVITSSRPDQVSLEMAGIDNSVFTHFLLKGLRGASDKDQDGVVTLEEVYQYVYHKTTDETNGVQHPQFEGSLVGKFPLSIRSGFKPDPDSIREFGATDKGSAIKTATMILKTSGPNIIARYGDRKLGQSGADGLMILEDLPVGKELSLTLGGDGLKGAVLKVEIPRDYEGRVYKHAEKILLKPEQAWAKGKIPRDDPAPLPRKRSASGSGKRGPKPNISRNVVKLECLGSERGARWLAADVRSGVVRLVHRAGGPASGSIWMIHRKGDDIIGLQCLRRFRRRSGWLDAGAAGGKVGLAPEYREEFMGVRWKAEKISPGVIALKSLVDPNDPKWLHGDAKSGKVSLKSSIKGNNLGARWRIHYERPPLSIIRSLKSRLDRSRQ
jgi:hypothetical protein